MYIFRKIMGWGYRKPDDVDGSTGGAAATNTGGDGTEETGGTTGGDDTGKDPANLLKSLNAERARAKEQQRLHEAAEAKAAEYERELGQLKKIDPKEYDRLLQAEKIRIEQENEAKGRWDLLREEKDLEISTLKTAKEQADNELRQEKITNAIARAFSMNGGFDKLPAVEGMEPVDALEVIRNYLGDRIQVDKGVIVIMDKYGKPEKTAEGKSKTLNQKMHELKQSGLGYLFKAEGTRSGNDTSRSGVANDGDGKIFTRQQAESGKADIEALATGKANIV
jgi:hypothetical protein